MTSDITIQNLDDLPSKNLATLVKFEWGEDFSNAAYYIAWTDDITISGTIYSSIPELKVEIETQHGGSKDASAKIIIPNSYSPITTLARPFPHSDCRVTVFECDPDDAVNTLYTLYFGYVSKILLGKFQSNSLAEISIIGLKSQADFAVGFPANSDCILDLFDIHCGVTEEIYTATIQSISDDGMTLVVSTPNLITTTTEIPTTTGAP